MLDPGPPGSPHTGLAVQYQPHLDASAAQMVLGKSPIIPGQILGDPGPPLNSTQVRSLLEQLYRLADRPPVPMSGKRTKYDISHTEDASHVYIKVDNPKNLHPKWEGPYPVVDRPSRSQLTVEIGRFKDNTPRLQTYHWSSAKIAHMRDGAMVGQRPMLGRKPKLDTNLKIPPDIPTARSEPANVSRSTGSVIQNQNIQPVYPSLVGPPPEIAEPANFQNELPSRPIRATRNQNPVYT